MDTLHMRRLNFQISLIGKISLIVILVEVVIFTYIGIYYINRFSREIDRRLEQQIQIPGILMNHQFLKYQAIADRGIMTELLGEELVDGLILGTDGNVYYALNPDERADASTMMPEQVSRWIDERAKATQILKISDTQGAFLISVTPLVAYEGQIPFYYVYIKINTNQSEQRKANQAGVFVTGSVASVGLTSLLILLFIRKIVTVPLAELEDNARQMTRGNLDQAISIAGDDELGSLARSFTLMRDAIRQKIVELQELNQTLEHKVERRTEELHGYVNRLEQEVAERQRAEEALTKSNRLLEAVIKQAPFAAHVLGGDRNHIHIIIENDESKRIMGESGEGRTDIDADAPNTITCRFFTVDGKQEIPLANMPGPRAVQGEIVRNEEFLFRHPDGTEILVEASASPVYDDADQIIAIVVTFHDITARKQIEKALRKSEQEIREFNATLETQVARRTRELEVANRELQSFAYVVSHDLKAPLRGISRLAAWLVEDYADAIDEKGREMSDLLIGRVKRMDDLIDGLLQYSRVGRIATTQKTLDLNDLLQAIIDSLAPPEHIHIVIETELPVIVGARIHVIQIFQNLLSNAIKFMDKLEGRITIGGEEHDTFQTFWVSDNGPGIDPKYHERIFQIFQTLRPRDEEENTGVGLAIVKKIIDLYGGEIRVKSEPGEGSTFIFTLPKNRPQE